MSRPFFCVPIGTFRKRTENHFPSVYPPLDFKDRELTDLPPIVLMACVDHDGVKYESLELVATMRFIQDEEIYLSNGYFAVNLSESFDEQEEIFDEFFPETN